MSVLEWLFNDLQYKKYFILNFDNWIEGLNYNLVQGPYN
jgi:hypothetical protein